MLLGPYACRRTCWRSCCSRRLLTRPTSEQCAAGFFSPCGSPSPGRHLPACLPCGSCQAPRRHCFTCSHPSQSSCLPPAPAPAAQPVGTARLLPPSPLLLLSAPASFLLVLPTPPPATSRFVDNLKTVTTRTLHQLPTELRRFLTRQYKDGALRPSVEFQACLSFRAAGLVGWAGGGRVSGVSAVAQRGAPGEPGGESR